VFYINVTNVDRDVTKVDRKVAHVAITIHLYFKCMFQMFHLYKTYVVSVSSRCCIKIDLDVTYTCMLQVYVPSVSYVCCKCFIPILHMFGMTFKYFFRCFASVSYVCCKCFIWLLQK
jgi:hypothetical protein